MSELLVLILAIAGFVIASKARKQQRALEQRIVALEQLTGAAAQPGTPSEQLASQAQTTAPKPQSSSAPVMPGAPEAKTQETKVAQTAEDKKEDESKAAVPPASGGTTPPKAPAMPQPGFEERFGTRWVVYVGGLALALGGIFLVKYSIEAGLIGPGLRVFFGALLAAALIGAGEYLRRKESIQSLARVPTAHIPSILIAAGTTVAYATIYAAYALYGFLNPAFAFILLGAVALATLAAALLHGPALAALGLVGAYVAPALVSTGQANYWALYLYVAVVTAAAFALARARLWRWLAITAVVFSCLWTLPGIGGTGAMVLVPHAFSVVVCFALAAVFIVSGLFYGPPALRGRIDAISCAALGAYLLVAALLVLATRHDGLAFATFALLATASVAIAWRTEAAIAAVPAAGALAAIVLAEWAFDTHLVHVILPGSFAAVGDAEPWRSGTSTHLFVGAAFAALFGASGFLSQYRGATTLAAVIWAATGVLTPLLILIALYYRVSGFERSVPFAAIALVLAAAFAYATEHLNKRTSKPGGAAATAIYASGTVAALALAFSFVLEKGWLTIALALMVPGIAYIAEKRPLPMLRELCAVLAALVIARVGYEPRILGDAIGATPIFNWILYGYGVPALAFWAGGFILRKRADDAPARMVDAAAIFFTVLLLTLEIRHYVNAGDIYARSAPLIELALHVCAGLAMAIGLERLRLRTRSIVHDIGALIIAALALCGIVFGLGLFENPLFTGANVGGRFVNLLLLGYGIPAVLAIILALCAQHTRPLAYRVVAAVTAVALAIAYLSLQVRALYHGPVLNGGGLSDAEGYTYSAVWLAFGVVLLLAGIALRSQPARLASAAVIMLTVAKVFLLDMAGLTGVYRALSFIGLGLVLVCIGLVYQRLLFPPRARATDTAAPATE